MQNLIIKQLQKTFVFEDQSTQKSVIINYFILLDCPVINLIPLLELYCPLSANRVVIYEPFTNRFVALRADGKNGFVLKEFLQADFILIRYTRIDLLREHEMEQSESSEPLGRKDRSKQRTISEVIALVKQWRQLHTCGIKRMNLQDAAKAIGVSKKSLDDYYYQLRLGEFYDFDFSTYRDEKIGFLRSFVRGFNEQKESKRNRRHPRKLKIIESDSQDGYEAKIEHDNKNITQIVDNNTSLDKGIVSQPQEIPSERQAEKAKQLTGLTDPFEKQRQVPFEDQFYKDFQYFLDDVSDPFLLMNFDFGKKQSLDFGMGYFQ